MRDRAVSRHRIRTAIGLVAVLRLVHLDQGVVHPDAPRGASGDADRGAGHESLGQLALDEVLGGAGQGARDEDGEHRVVAGQTTVIGQTEDGVTSRSQPRPTIVGTEQSWPRMLDRVTTCLDYHGL